MKKKTNDKKLILNRIGKGIYSLVIIAVVAFGLWGSFRAFAWVDGGATPPTPNVAAPLNTGANDQTKSGSLSVTGAGKSITAPKVCIGADCRTVWPNSGPSVAGDVNGDGVYNYKDLPSGSIAGYCDPSGASLGGSSKLVVAPELSGCSCVSGWTSVSFYQASTGVRAYTCIKN